METAFGKYMSIQVRFLDRVTQLPSPFRGVNKVYLQQYVAIHEWAHNIKTYSVELLRVLCGITQFAS